MKFSLGKTVATPGALNALEEIQENPMTLLSRHANGDWGNMDDDDKELNNDALIHGGRIFSSYIVNDVKFWVITEADRSSTCVLLPEEY